MKMTARTESSGLGMDNDVPGDVIPEIEKQTVDEVPCESTSESKRLGVLEFKRRNQIAEIENGPLFNPRYKDSIYSWEHLHDKNHNVNLDVFRDRENFVMRDTSIQDKLKKELRGIQGDIRSLKKIEKIRDYFDGKPKDSSKRKNIDGKPKDSSSGSGKSKDSRVLDKQAIAKSFRENELPEDYGDYRRRNPNQIEIYRAGDVSWRVPRLHEYASMVIEFSDCCGDGDQTCDSENKSSDEDLNACRKMLLGGRIVSGNRNDNDNSLDVGNSDGSSNLMDEIDKTLLHPCDDEKERRTEQYRQSGDLHGDSIDRHHDGDPNENDAPALIREALTLLKNTSSDLKDHFRELLTDPTGRVTEIFLGKKRKRICDAIEKSISGSGNSDQSSANDRTSVQNRNTGPPGGMESLLERMERKDGRVKVTLLKEDGDSGENDCGEMLGAQGKQGDSRLLIEFWTHRKRKKRKINRKLRDGRTFEVELELSNSENDDGKENDERAQDRFESQAQSAPRKPGPTRFELLGHRVPIVFDPELERIWKARMQRAKEEEFRTEQKKTRNVSGSLLDLDGSQEMESVTSNAEPVSAASTASLSTENKPCNSHSQCTPIFNLPPRDKGIDSNRYSAMAVEILETSEKLEEKDSQSSDSTVPVNSAENHFDFSEKRSSESTTIVPYHQSQRLLTNFDWKYIRHWFKNEAEWCLWVFAQNAFSKTIAKTSQMMLHDLEFAKSRLMSPLILCNKTTGTADRTNLLNIVEGWKSLVMTEGPMPFPFREKWNHVLQLARKKHNPNSKSDESMNLLTQCIESLTDADDKLTKKIEEQKKKLEKLPSLRELHIPAIDLADISIELPNSQEQIRKRLEKTLTDHLEALDLKRREAFKNMTAYSACVVGPYFDIDPDPLSETYWKQQKPEDPFFEAVLWDKFRERPQAKCEQIRELIAGRPAGCGAQGSDIGHAEDSLRYDPTVSESHLAEHSAPLQELLEAETKYQTLYLALDKLQSHVVAEFAEMVDRKNEIELLQFRERKKDLEDWEKTWRLQIMTEGVSSLMTEGVPSSFWKESLQINSEMEIVLENFKAEAIPKTVIGINWSKFLEVLTRPEQTEDCGDDNYHASPFHEDENDNPLGRLDVVKDGIVEKQTEFFEKQINCLVEGVKGRIGDQLRKSLNLRTFLDEDATASDFDSEVQKSASSCRKELPELMGKLIQDHDKRIHSACLEAATKVDGVGAFQYCSGFDCDYDRDEAIKLIQKGNDGKDSNSEESRIENSTLASGPGVFLLPQRWREYFQEKQNLKSCFFSELQALLGEGEDVESKRLEIKRLAASYANDAGRSLNIAGCGAFGAAAFGAANRSSLGKRGVPQTEKLPSHQDIINSTLFLELDEDHSVFSSKYGSESSEADLPNSYLSTRVEQLYEEMRAVFGCLRKSLIRKIVENSLEVGKLKQYELILNARNFVQRWERLARKVDRLREQAVYYDKDASRMRLDLESVWDLPPFWSPFEKKSEFEKKYAANFNGIFNEAEDDLRDGTNGNYSAASSKGNYNPVYEHDFWAHVLMNEIERWHENRRDDESQISTEESAFAEDQRLNTSTNNSSTSNNSDTTSKFLRHTAKRYTLFLGDSALLNPLEVEILYHRYRRFKLANLPEPTEEEAESFTEMRMQILAYGDSNSGDDCNDLQALKTLLQEVDQKDFFELRRDILGLEIGSDSDSEARDSEDDSDFQNHFDSDSEHCHKNRETPKKKSCKAVSFDSLGSSDSDSWRLDEGRKTKDPSGKKRRGKKGHGNKNLKGNNNKNNGFGKFNVNKKHDLTKTSEQILADFDKYNLKSGLADAECRNEEDPEETLRQEFAKLTKEREPVFKSEMRALQKEIAEKSRKDLAKELGLKKFYLVNNQSWKTRRRLAPAKRRFVSQNLMTLFEIAAEQLETMKKILEYLERCFEIIENYIGFLMRISKDIVERRRERLSAKYRDKWMFVKCGLYLQQIKPRILRNSVSSDNSAGPSILKGVSDNQATKWILDWISKDSTQEECAGKERIKKETILTGQPHSMGRIQMVDSQSGSHRAHVNRGNGMHGNSQSSRVITQSRDKHGSKETDEEKVRLEKDKRLHSDSADVAKPALKKTDKRMMFF